MTKSALAEERPKVFVPCRSICVRPSMVTLASMERAGAGAGAGRAAGFARGAAAEAERAGSGVRRGVTGREPEFGDSPTIGFAREIGS